MSAGPARMRMRRGSRPTAYLALALIAYDAMPLLASCWFHTKPSPVERVEDSLRPLPHACTRVSCDEARHGNRQDRQVKRRRGE